jgi:hypothetical protein
VGSYYSGISVTLGGHPVSVSNLTSTTLTVTVPTNVTSERMKVIVTAGGQVTELPGEFTILAPTITSVSPRSGLTGSSVTISGTNFNIASYYNNTNRVRFGSTEASITNATTSSITVTVPSTLSPGTYPVSVSTGVHSVTAAENFVVVSPAITGFSPASGTAGTEVLIEGIFHPATYYNNTTVKFGTVAASVSHVTTTSIRAIVPSYIPAGKIKIFVTSNNQTITSVDDFEIPAVKLTGFLPTSAVPGTRVTIFGSGFSLDKNYNRVKFGTYDTSVIEVTPTSLTVLVPSSVAFGAMKISVEVHGQIVTSVEDFVVVNQ